MNNTYSTDLKALRALAPNRQLTWTEELAVVARQANRFRQRHQLTTTRIFDTDVIADQPRTHVEIDDQMPMAGSSHWTGSHWQILINADDHPNRQRFTLAHEYKHIIDNRRPIDPDFEERICDHFAACLLMPKRLIIAAWTQGDIERTTAAMAKAFAVSRPAMSYRLTQLGLLPPRPRCDRRNQPNNRPAGLKRTNYRDQSANTTRSAA